MGGHLPVPSPPSAGERVQGVTSITVGIAVLIEVIPMPSLALDPCSGPAIRAIHFIQIR